MLLKMKCPNCQNENSDSSKFCKTCGFKLEGLNLGPEPVVPASPASSPSCCPSCGAPLKPGAKFCSKCGNTIATAPVPPIPPAPPVPPTLPSGYEEGGFPPGGNPPVPPILPSGYEEGGNPPGGNPPAPKKKGSPAIIIGVAVLLVLLLGVGGYFAVTKTGALGSLPFAKKTADSGNEKDSQEAEEEDVAAPLDEDASAKLDEELAPIEEQVAAGEEKAKSGDHAGACEEFTAALEAYAALAPEYEDTDAAFDQIDDAAVSAFDLYTTSILKQVEGWESQSPTAPLYQQVDITMKGAFEFVAKLQEAGLSIQPDTLDQSYAEFPGRYKKIYIKAFNDMMSAEQWSRSTAWNLMQDAASVGLVDRENADDPLTLRYAFADAWITQKKVSEGRNDGSMTDQEAVDVILAVIKNADCNPVLVRELALCYESLGNAGNAKTLKTACVDVYNYLANNENVYINGEDLFVPGNNTNASSTIPLINFWYFNDFGEYSPSITNGIKPEGRGQVRSICENAINSLQ